MRIGIIRGLKICVLFVSVTVFSCLFGGCSDNLYNLSLENRDYVVEMSVAKEQEGYNFYFVIADLTEYAGDTGKSMKKMEYECVAENVSNAIEKYYDENERQLDLGHMNKIILAAGTDRNDCDSFFLELGNMPAVEKSVMVYEESGSSKSLREVIKECY